MIRVFTYMYNKKKNRFCETNNTVKGTNTANYKILDTLHLKTITVFLISKFEKKGQTLTLSKFK